MLERTRVQATIGVRCTRRMPGILEREMLFAVLLPILYTLGLADRT